jgi:hypothetical protein
MGIFIRPPYIECPKCAEKKFGINGIFDYHYSRRCDNCGYPKPWEKPYTTPLPKINRKIIYLDQFIISNFMKVLHPDFRESFDKKQFDFWYNLFGKLDRIIKLQLIISPYSEAHTDESLMSKYFKPLKKIYELLGHGISFSQPSQIISSQIIQIAKHWIANEHDYDIEIITGHILNKRTDAWFDRFFISMTQNWLFDFKEDTHRLKSSYNNGLVRSFKRWQNGAFRSFDDQYKLESESFGKTYLRIYAEHSLNLLNKFKNPKSLTFNDIEPPPAVWAIIAVEDILEKHVESKETRLKKIKEFFLSNDIQKAPYIKIQSMLFAALARKAAAGQKKMPSPGMTYDIQTISALLPYCDAMFIDNECHSLLNEKPLSTDLNYRTDLFSLNNKEDFLAYLDDIEKNMSEDHYKKVLEVYGEGFIKPYYSIFEKGE